MVSEGRRHGHALGPACRHHRAEREQVHASCSQRNEDRVAHGILTVLLDRTDDASEHSRGFMSAVCLHEEIPEAAEGLSQLSEKLGRDLPDGLRLPSQLADVVAVANRPMAEGLAVLRSSDDELLDLLSAAFRIRPRARNRFWN